ncbi:BTB/POZ domain-containing protein 19 isoform X2 [Vulpes lagopus]|uniref:BTB/POZ domain-containing protein 19 isoform X2 n=1 Tax=Vulpes lagopus TaxID=494514 RepID=UPI001BCA4794|nr:BTB/POZ domain-containing protein 19 isoform X2 [Vulpes lagopus]
METPGLVVQGEAASFSTALRSLLNNPQYSDVCFVVGQERQEVFAHRCLLACRCNFFRGLLGPKLGPGMPSPVVLSTVPAEAFLAVLEFLYTNSVRLHRHSVLEVLTAAVEYGLEELRAVGLYGRPGSRFAFLPWAQFTPCLTHTVACRGTCTNTQLCLEFVVKVMDVEMVCEALQVGVAGRACRWASAWRPGPHGLPASNLPPFLLFPGCRDLWPGSPAGALRSLHRGPQPGGAPDPRLLGAVGARLAAPAAQRQALRGRGRAGPGRPELGARRRGRAGAACGRGGGPGGAGAETGLTGPGGAERPGGAEPAGAAHPGADAGDAAGQGGRARVSHRLRGDRPSPAGGADRGGVEVPRSAERGCDPGRPVPPPEGDPAPGAPRLSGSAP